MPLEAPRTPWGNDRGNLRGYAGPVQKAVQLATDQGADLKAAIARLTHALATANDDTIADFVAERRALRAELEDWRRAKAGNVVVLDPNRPHG